MNKKKTVIVIGALLATTSLFQAYHTFVPSSKNHAAQSIVVADAQAEDAAVKYTCPMHPQVRLPKSGKCPICSMPLILTKAAAPAPKWESPQRPETGARRRNRRRSAPATRRCGPA